MNTPRGGKNVCVRNVFHTSVVVRSGGLGNKTAVVPACPLVWLSVKSPSVSVAICWSQGGQLWLSPRFIVSFKHNVQRFPRGVADRSTCPSVTAVTVALSFVVSPLPHGEFVGQAREVLFMTVDLIVRQNVPVSPWPFADCWL